MSSSDAEESEDHAAFTSAGGSSAVVLAGGMASRLGDISIRTPKPLLEVCGVPFLRLLLEKLRREGIEDVVVVTGNLAETVESYLTEIAPVVGPVRTVRSQNGTAAAFAAGLRICEGDTAVLLNGDTILDIDFRRLTRSHWRNPFPVTIATTTRRGVPNEGAVKVLNGREVIAFLEGVETSVSSDRQSPYEGRAGMRSESNCGCYVVTPSHLEGRLHWEGSFERQVLVKLADEGQVGAFSIGDGFFLDFGTPTRLADVAVNEDVIREIYDL